MFMLIVFWGVMLVVRLRRLRIVILVGRSRGAPVGGGLSGTKKTQKSQFLNNKFVLQIAAVILSISALDVRRLLLLLVYHSLILCLCFAYMWLTLCLRFATHLKMTARCEGSRFRVACGGVVVTVVVVVVVVVVVIIVVVVAVVIVVQQ